MAERRMIRTGAHTHEWIEAPIQAGPCRFLRERVGNVDCPTCTGRVSLKLFNCDVHGQCTQGKKVPNIASCVGCFEYQEISPTIPHDVPKVPNTPRKTLKWSYGVTTVPSRRDDLLPRTLESLKAAGFDAPRLFIDGAKGPYAAWDQLQYTCRYPAVRCAGNWILSLMELYLREPCQDRYALFQDDLITLPNLRRYLEVTPYQRNTYLNLYTFPVNQALTHGRIKPGKKYAGFYPSNQLGKGALALVFDNDAVRALLTSKHLYDRAMNETRGHKSIDGGIVTAMRNVGYQEYVHDPSLVQHIGEVSTVGNAQHPKAESFVEGMDALSLKNMI